MTNFKLKIWAVRLVASIFLVMFASATPLLSQTIVSKKLFHLRNGDTQEWTEFGQHADSEDLELEFDCETNADLETLICTLQLRQQDVKQRWEVSINEKRIGNLIQDESNMIRSFEIPAGILKASDNTLTIAQSGTASDDIRVGQITIFYESRQQHLSARKLNVTVVDAENNSPVPCRLTIVDSDNSLVELNTPSNETLAIRTGVVYSSTGKAWLELPALKSYRIIASRGFEWSIAEEIVEPADDNSELTVQLVIGRVVSTPGWVAMDTHVHTRTHSGHGDSTIEERMITIAGEGIELPIATDHNKHIDYQPLASKLNVRKFFTPVIGNEVTTKIGHFNIFPIQRGEDPPTVDGKDWSEVFAAIGGSTTARIFILNHARDTHSGYRPFDPLHHNSIAGENLDDWKLQANAMEILNSGAIQTDVMELTRDWFGLLNSGRKVTPVGSSDSHDVSRYIVGQGRTYVRCDDTDPGEIDVQVAVDNFLKGRVSVSYGLFADVTVNGKYGPGDLVPPAETYKATVRVLGPDWVQATHVGLYVNGRLYDESPIEKASGNRLLDGVQFEWEVLLNDLPHDVFISAVALGNGITEPHWPTAKPYQPDSQQFEAKTIGISGAIWIDVNGDGKAESARAIANERLTLFDEYDFAPIFKSIDDDHPSISAQVAYLLNQQGVEPIDDRLEEILGVASQGVKDGFRQYVEAWRMSQMARASK